MLKAGEALRRAGARPDNDGKDDFQKRPTTTCIHLFCSTRLYIGLSREVITLDLSTKKEGNISEITWKLHFGTQVSSSHDGAMVCFGYDT